MSEKEPLTIEKQKEIKESGLSLKDFWHFFKNTSAVGLAIGVVMASSVNKLVDVIVNGLVTPFLSLFIPDSNFTVLNVNIAGSVFRFGDLVAALINILIVSVLIYLIVKGLLKDEELLPAKQKKAKVKLKEKDEAPLFTL